MKSIVLVCLCVAACFPLAAQQKPSRAYSIPTPAEPNFSNVDWLIGEWAGKTVGKGPTGEVLLSASYELGRYFMVIREQVSLPATKGAPATHEGEMGILSASPSGKSFDLTLYSTHGFVTRYQVTATKGQIDFNPAGGPMPPSGWLFRWNIARSGNNQCSVRVDVAPPGQSFFNYYTALLSQVTRGTTTSAVPAGTASQGTPPKHKRFSLGHPEKQEQNGAPGGN